VFKVKSVASRSRNSWQTRTPSGFAEIVKPILGVTLTKHGLGLSRLTDIEDNRSRARSAVASLKTVALPTELPRMQCSGCLCTNPRSVAGR
jgi:hypothetical protein